MKTLPLVFALTTASVLASEKPTELQVVQENTHRSTETIVQKSSRNAETLETLGLLFLGNVLLSLAYSGYERRTPPEKRMSARVLQKIGESKSI